MKKDKAIFKVILGLLVAILGIYVVVYWRWHVWALFKGSLGPLIFLVGLLTLYIGMTSLKE